MDKLKLKVKNLIIISLLMVTLILMTACQPTPKIQPVVGVNDETMKQILSSGVDYNDFDEHGNQYAFKEIKVPDHITTDYKECGKMNLVFNADVIIPNTTAYPVVEAGKRVFSDEQLLDLIERFAGSSDELYSTWNLTKQDWLDKQIQFKEKDPEGKLAPYYLEYLQQMYDDADEEVYNEVVEISDLPTETTSQIFVRQDNGTVAFFRIARDDNSFVYYRDMFMSPATASLYKDENFNPEFDTIEQFSWRQSKEPEISQEDAYVQALKYIDELEIDLDLLEAETCAFLVDVVGKSVGWTFTFTRKLSNAQVQFDSRGFIVDDEAMPSYGAPWDVELCKIGIDKNGLCFLEYYGASQINKVVMDTVELEQFDTIQKRVENQLNYIYGTSTRGNDVGLDIKISDIKLGTSLISVKDQTEKGIYIPTWYVDYYIKWSDADEDEWELNTIIFNAIDGSYIEPRVTNQKIMSIVLKQRS